jgi:hypothetical protein
MSSEHEWSLQNVIEQATKELGGDELDSDLVTKIFQILRKHQFRTNRDRPRELIVRLINEYFEE